MKPAEGDKSPSSQKNYILERSFSIFEKRVMMYLYKIAYLLPVAWLLLQPLNGQTVPDSLFRNLGDSLQTNDAFAIADAYSDIAGFYSESEDHNEAIRNFEIAGQYYRQSGAFREFGVTLFNIGNAYFNLSEYPNALQFYQQSSEIFDSIQFTRGVIATYKSFGLVYDLQDEYERSLEYYQMALFANKNLNDTIEFADLYNNLAIVKIRQISDDFQTDYGDYWQDSILKFDENLLKGFFNPVLRYADSSFYYYNSIGFVPGMARAMITRNQVSMNTGDFDTAIKTYYSILNEYNDVLSDYEKGVIKNNLAHCHTRIKEYTRSSQLLEESRNIAERLGYKELYMHYYLRLSDLNNSRGDYRDALKNFKTYVQYKDSIFNEQKLQAIKDAEVKYETRAKEQEIIALNRENMLKKKRLNVMVAGVVLVSILLLIALYFWNITRKQRDKITIQSKRITLQKEEIEASIRSAETIQFAALPAAAKVKQILPDSFVLFRPRDHVSGDFYWISDDNGKVYVLTADCEGHGVPGAFLSMMGFALISEMVAVYPDQDAGFILGKLRNKLIESLCQVGESAATTQTMDVSFYILQADKRSIDFAGAKNPLYILRNGEILKYDGDNMPVGAHPRDKEDFTNHTIPLQPEDTLFTFSDGYWDQFGGPNNKKYMKKRFRELLQSTANVSIAETEEKLNRELNEWQGEHQQNDDILVIGVRI
jgi:serine phosphatase RsbU (regulator of sigma subunit)